MKDKFKKDMDNVPDTENADIETNPAAESDSEVSESKSDNIDSASETNAQKGDFESAAKISVLEKALADEKDKYIRLAAEYDNYRKRAFQDKQNAVIDASSKTIIEILSVIDNFERALAAESTDANYKKGVEMIFNQYKEVLSKLGVSEIEALGKPFDPNFHNAVNQVQDENFGENTVCQVFQKGYLLGDRVVRCAMVVVANP